MELPICQHRTTCPSDGELIHCASDWVSPRREDSCITPAYCLKCSHANKPLRGKPRVSKSKLTEEQREQLVNARLHPYGPGRELVKIIRKLGIFANGKCGCGVKATQMNEWGVEGCRARRDEIAGWLRSKAKEMTTGEWIAAAARVVLAGFNPLDPFGSIMDEAIRLAELPRPTLAPKANAQR